MCKNVYTLGIMEAVDILVFSLFSVYLISSALAHLHLFLYR